MEALQDAPEVKNPLEDAGAVVDMTEVQVAPEEYSSQETEEKEQYQQQPEEEKEVVDWEQKYRVLKGKYDKEIPRLQKKIRMLERERNELFSRIEVLEKALLSKENTSQDNSIEEDEELARLKEEYPDIYKAMVKLIEKSVKKDLEMKINNVTNQVSKNQFEAQLTALVPEWRELNYDPDFIDWLQEVEPSTGYTRHQLMLFAYNNGDAHGVARWFKKYLEEANKSAEKPQAYKSVSPVSKRKVSSGQVSKKLFTESEINKFYRDKALGRIPPDKAERLEEEIIKAITENRVIYGK